MLERIKKAFTLIELVVVIAVIAVLSAVSVVTYIGVTDSANRSVVEQEVTNFRDLYNTYLLLNQSNAQVETSYGINDEIELHHFVEDFYEYCSDNGLNSNYLNYKIKVNDKENGNGQIAFLIGSENTFFGGFAAQFEGYSLKPLNSEESLVVDKDLTKVSKEILGVNPSEEINPEDEFVFDINSKDNKDKIEKSNVVVVELKAENKTEQYVLRTGNKITAEIFNEQDLTGDNIYVSSDNFVGSTYDSKNKYYYINADFIYFDQNKNISLDEYYNSEIVLNEENTVLVEEDGKNYRKITFDYIDNSKNNPWKESDVVATKQRSTKTIIERYDDSAVADLEIYNKSSWQEKVTHDKNSVINYHFVDGNSAFNSLSKFTSYAEIRTYKLKEQKGDCGGGSTIAKESTYTTTIGDSQVSDTLFVKKSLELSGEIHIPEGVNVNVYHTNNLNDFSSYSLSNYGKDATIVPFTEKGSINITLTENSKLVIDGNLTLSATISTTSGSQKNSGSLTSTDNFSELILEDNSEVILDNKNANLNVYGRISGAGTLTAKKGTIYDKFTLYDWKGGSNLYGAYDSLKDKNVKGGSPFYEYYISDIACNSNIYSGIEYKLLFSIYGGGGNHDATINLFGKSNSIFEITDGYINKKIDLTDRSLDFEVYGTIETHLLELKVSLLIFSVELTGENFAFPIYNMNFVLKKGSVVNFNEQSLEFLPNSSLTIEEGATLNVNSSLTIFDQFKYFDGTQKTKFSAMYTELGQITNNEIVKNYGTINVYNGAEIGGKFTNYANGKIVFVDGEDSVKKEITPVIVIDCTGSNTSSKPVFYTNPQPIKFEQIQGGDQ